MPVDEFHTLGTEFVYIGSFHKISAIAVQPAGSKVVSQNKNNVGSAVIGSIYAGCHSDGTG